MATKTAKQKKPPSGISGEFVEFLKGLKAGDSLGSLSALRRYRKGYIFEIAPVLSRFYKMPVSQEKAMLFASVAKMFAIWPKASNGRLGSSLHPLLAKFSYPAMSRRFRAFLASRNVTAAIQHAESLVRLASSKKIPVGYADLLYGLLNWDHQDRWVQNRFSSDFWTVTEEDK